MKYKLGDTEVVVLGEKGNKVLFSPVGSTDKYVCSKQRLKTID